MQKTKNILLCPLDWGLGHASRCVPIIRALLERNQNILIAASGRPLVFLQDEFPSLKFIDFPGYDIKYPEKSSMHISMLMQVPGILQKIKKEHEQLKEIVRRHEIDVVFSDNRYGLWHEDVLSIFMTHQLKIKAGNAIIENFLKKINMHYIRKFDACCVPDFPDEQNLSGTLSHFEQNKPTARFIGPQSRFSVYPVESVFDKRYTLMILISGPEPQRSIFEEKVLTQADRIKVKTLVLAGKPERHEHYHINDFVEVKNHMDSHTLLNHMKNSEIILSRSGYSTIMDLAYLKKKAIFIPTPGQTEQEYLAKYHASRGHCVNASQRTMNIQALLEAANDIRGFDLKFETGLLNGFLADLIS